MSNQQHVFSIFADQSYFDAIKAGRVKDNQGYIKVESFQSNDVPANYMVKLLETVIQKIDNTKMIIDKKDYHNLKTSLIKSQLQSMKPTIGRVVIYTTTQDEREAMKNSNQNVAEQLPGIVVSVHGDDENAPINVKVLMDGDGPDLWKTSIQRGDQPGEWQWPTRV